MFSAIHKNYSEFRLTVMQNSVALENAPSKDLSILTRLITKIANAIFMLSSSYQNERKALLQSDRQSRLTKIDLTPTSPVLTPDPPVPPTNDIPQTPIIQPSPPTVDTTAKKISKKVINPDKPRPVQLPHRAPRSIFDPANILYKCGNWPFVSSIASKAAGFIGIPPAFTTLAPVHHSMSTHVYRQGSVTNDKGIVIGSLKYVGDVPVLKLSGETAFESGYAQGQLLTNAITQSRKKAQIALYGIQRMPRPESISNELERIKNALPKRFVEEMEGLVKGYNQKIETESLSKTAPRESAKIQKLTLNELLYLHLIPDSLHFHPKRNSELESSPLEMAIPNQLQNMPLAACTFLAQRSEEEGVVVARNMDWSSFNVAGTYSLIVSRNNPETGIRTAEVSVPGMIGTLTGMNDKGLCVAMNVCSDTKRKEDRGLIPACLYNRMILDTCHSVEEVRKEVSKKSNEALGPYHLSAADEKEACTISLYHNENNGIAVRNLSDSQSLLTTNRWYDTSDPSHMFYSQEREANIHTYLTAQQGRPLDKSLNEALSLDHVNNSLTTHSVMMLPGKREMRVSFDNAWAGDKPKHLISFSDI